MSVDLDPDEHRAIWEFRVFVAASGRDLARAVFPKVARMVATRDPCTIQGVLSFGAESIHNLVRDYAQGVGLDGRPELVEAVEEDCRQAYCQQFLELADAEGFLPPGVPGYTGPRKYRPHTSEGAA